MLWILPVPRQTLVKGINLLYFLGFLFFYVIEKLCALVRGPQGTELWSHRGLCLIGGLSIVLLSCCFCCNTFACQHASQSWLSCFRKGEKVLLLLTTTLWLLRRPPPRYKCGQSYCPLKKCLSWKKKKNKIILVLFRFHYEALLLIYALFLPRFLLVKKKVRRQLKIRMLGIIQ